MLRAEVGVGDCVTVCTMLRRGRLVVTMVAAGVALALAPASAAAVPCADVAAYPGDGAARAAIAQWMAYGAGLAATPRELPVMGALVESGLTNLHIGDVDSVGYFGMRLGIWNRGEYAGYPENPPLQLKWFLDHAAAVRKKRLAAGATDPAADEQQWGAWIADVVVAPENLRGRYQLRLGEARTLVDEPCLPPPVPGQPLPPPAPSGPSSPPAADTTAPLLRLSGARRQRALHAGAIVVTVRCPAEPCTTSATAQIALPRARRALKLTLRRRALAVGEERRLRFVPGAGDRARLRAALRSRRSLTASVRVRAIDAAGNAGTQTRTVRVTG
jgi:hypothetical protein